jgi:16S rRNA (cytosine1402-N4)-methyltransferase
VSRAYHIPVLADEVLDLLAPRPGQTVIDGTLGGGGHALRLGEKLQPTGRLVVIDQDPAALEEAENRLKGLSLSIIPIRGNFRNLSSLLDERSIASVDGVLLDLGVSSHQLDAGERGFSFRAEAPLDMRMGPTEGETAAELLARLDERELTRILFEFGEERWAARIARFVVDRRSHDPIWTTKQLADVVMAAVPKGARPADIHPATRVFQALRIAVNDELGALRDALHSAVRLLARGGRIAVISYHSLEDRIVKQAFARFAGKCECPPRLPICQCGATEVIRLVTRKPVVPTAGETAANPRARSAKLRVAEKL